MKKQNSSTKAALSNQIEAAAKEAEMNVAEFTETALRWMVDMTEANPVFVRSYCKTSVEEQRKGTRKETHPHPFMERLFSRDLQVMHGPNFLAGKNEDVGLEHVVSAAIINRIMAMDIESAAAEAEGYGRSIINCPLLMNEAHALLSFSDAVETMKNFCWVNEI